MSSWSPTCVWTCDVCEHQETRDTDEGPPPRWAIGISVVDLDAADRPFVHKDQDLCERCSRVYGRVYASMMAGPRSEIGEKNAIPFIETMRWPNGRPSKEPD